MISVLSSQSARLVKAVLAAVVVQTPIALLTILIVRKLSLSFTSLSIGGSTSEIAYMVQSAEIIVPCLIAYAIVNVSVKRGSP